jgi:hypothetical protein
MVAACCRAIVGSRRSNGASARPRMSQARPRNPPQGVLHRREPQYGATVSSLTGVFEPNFGLGGVTLFAHASRDACP